MATIQHKITNGHKYWYIVESRRVNGKPRPVVLEYLGKADTLLERLNCINDYKLKSYEHGHVAALLELCSKLDICSIINNFTMPQRKYMAGKPIRHHLTVGGTLMLAIIARACKPESKNGFVEWSKTTSLSYMLRVSLSKVSSQHFWDMMDCIPVDSIAAIEAEIIKKVSNIFDLDVDKILYDTTNYYTYIDTSNYKPTIAKRGKNKQKRGDLRQVGLALVVTRKDRIPVYHHSYAGNSADQNIFINVVDDIIKRMAELDVDINKQTIVFDKGANSKKNLKHVDSLGLKFVGSFSPSHCKELIIEAEPHLAKFSEGFLYRARRIIWGLDLSVVVMISDKLKIGLIHGLYTSIEKCDAAIVEINKAVLKPNAKKITSEQLNEKVLSLIKKYKSSNYIEFDIVDGDMPQIEHRINYKALASAEEELGFRIIITTRHEWNSDEIVKAYHGQAFIEDSFKNMKDPQHLSLRPQFHWTNHKIRVHNFCCVAAYLLNALLFKQAKEDAGYSGCMGSFLDALDNIRLGSVIRSTGKQGRPRVVYSVEVPDDGALRLVDVFNLNTLHEKRPKIEGLSKY